MKMKTEKRALDKIYKRRNRYEIPEWQRGAVWPITKKQNLIDSILREWKLPKFYFLKTNDTPETYDVVDGQQRLSAIFEFYENELSLSPKSIEMFGGAFYKDLDDSITDKFDDFEIEYDLIEEGTDEEVKEYFQRLQEGMQLTSSEKLNSMHSNVREFAAEISNNRFFKDLINVSNKRYGHFDIACKVIAIEIDGIDAGIRYEDIHSLFENYASLLGTCSQFTNIRKALSRLNEIFTVKEVRLQSRAIVQSFITLISCIKNDDVVFAKNKELIHAFFTHFLGDLEKQVEAGNKAKDIDYIDFQRTISANTKNGVRLRHEVLLRKILTFNPKLSSLFESTQLLDMGIKANITKITESIQKEIQGLNEKYQALKGKDLFKMTNNTVPALQRIGISIDTEAKFNQYINDLYFLFRESIGQRFENHLPQSFVDVNTIRTGLDHDVDHGEDRDIAKKRKKIADTLEKYSTKRTFAELNVIDYYVFQLSLSTAINNDLLEIDVGKLQ